MADYQLIIIGGGLSGIAAGIRAARFGIKTLVLEQHSLPGGLNSYYRRKGYLLETGLHAMTNHAPAKMKHLPLNRLFRQLKLSRKQFTTYEQYCSEIRFPDLSLRFSNNPSLLEQEVAEVFPQVIDRFRHLRERILAYDPFAIAPWRSTRAFLSEILAEPRLEEMLLLPVMVYGNAEELDMDLGQFVIMFRSIFEEGFFRPAETIKEFLDLLFSKYRSFDGEIRYNTAVQEICFEEGRACGVRLTDGAQISADAILSTIGMPGTIRLTDWDTPVEDYQGKMSFLETVSVAPGELVKDISDGRTIVFYSKQQDFSYSRPAQPVELAWGVICFPDNFHGIETREAAQVRTTNAADYVSWKKMEPQEYQEEKQLWTDAAISNIEELIGRFGNKTLYRDSFTPLTIERYTRKAEGAVYGSPVKIKDGKTPWPNLFIAGTDQGYLGIIGAMLSGVTVVNQRILNK